MARRVKRRWSLALLAALTAFAQFVMAAEPCRLAHQPAAPMQHPMSADEQCDAMPMDQAACLAQCLGGDESFSTPNPLFMAAIACAPASPRVVLPDTRFAPLADRAAPSCGPPLQILYCSYQS